MKIQIHSSAESAQNSYSSSKTKQTVKDSTSNSKLKAPDVKGLPTFAKLKGKYDLVKHKDPNLKTHFPGMDVVMWANVNGDVALVVGVFIPTFPSGDGVQFAQMNSKNELSQINRNVARFASKGATVEMLAGANHFLLYTYAA